MIHKLTKYFNVSALPQELSGFNSKQGTVAAGPTGVKQKALTALAGKGNSSYSTALMGPSILKECRGGSNKNKTIKGSTYNKLNDFIGLENQVNIMVYSFFRKLYIITSKPIYCIGNKEITIKFLYFIPDRLLDLPIRAGVLKHPKENTTNNIEKSNRLKTYNKINIRVPAADSSPGILPPASLRNAGEESSLPMGTGPSICRGGGEATVRAGPLGHYESSLLNDSKINIDSLNNPQNNLGLSNKSLNICSENITFDYLEKYISLLFSKEVVPPIRELSSPAFLKDAGGRMPGELSLPGLKKIDYLSRFKQKDFSSAPALRGRGESSPKSAEDIVMARIQFLGMLLSKLFNMNISIEATRVKYPQFDSKIFAEYLGIKSFS